MCAMAENTTLQVDEDRSLHVLMNHCREMKRQEFNLRIATAFVLMGCAALILYLNFQHCGPLSDKQSELTESKAPGGIHQRQIGSKPAFHLTAAHDSVQTQERYVAWTDKGDTVHLHRFKYDNCMVIVESPGLYHIYLQITYRKPEAYNCTQSIYLGPRVEFWHDSYPSYEPMMAASGTLLCKETIEKSIYTAGIYQLEKGSKLRVQYGAAKDLTVQTDHKKMFFGAYLI